MTYDVILSPKAEESFLSFDLPLQNAVEAQLHRLAESPVSLSRPAVMPYPPHSQLYEFPHELDGERHHFAILFRYATDEQTLHVIGIGHVNYGEL